MIHSAEFRRFLLVGGACFLLNLLLLYAMVDGLKLHYLLANVISFGILVIVGHYLNRTHTFRSGGVYGSELARFAVLTATQAATGLAAMALLVEVGKVPYLLAAVVVTASLAVVSFLVQRRVVFSGRSDDIGALPARDMAGWLRHDGYMIGCLDRAIAAALDHAGCGSGTRVLDLGSGSQPYASILQARGARYTPCDLGDGNHVSIHVGEVLPLPNEEFDLGLSVQVLEHVWDLDEYLGRFRRHLAPGGRLILSTHGVWLYHPHPTDYRRWTRDGLVAELESRGFPVDRVLPVLGPLAWTTQFRCMGYVYALNRLGAPGRVLAAIVALAMNVRMWLEDQVTPAALTLSDACVYVMVCRIAGPGASEPAAGPG
jgi:putative flippase GtrA